MRADILHLSFGETRILPRPSCLNTSKAVCSLVSSFTNVHSESTGLRRFAPRTRRKILNQVDSDFAP